MTDGVNRGGRASMKLRKSRPVPSNPGSRTVSSGVGIGVIFWCRSKPRNIRKRHPPGMHMHAAELGAAVQGREYFAGIEQALVVEGAFDALLRLEIDFRKHHRHQIAFLDADAVLAGEHAADLDAQA